MIISMMRLDDKTVIYGDKIYSLEDDKLYESNINFKTGVVSKKICIGSCNVVRRMYHADWF